MNCASIERTAISPGNGNPINRCRLVSIEGGIRNTWIPVSRCERECSQKDDGASYASKVILEILKRRMVLDWQQEAYLGCGGSALTVEEALTRLKGRVGAEEAGKVLVLAVENGMSAEEAERLANLVLPEAISGIT